MAMDATASTAVLLLVSVATWNTGIVPAMVVKLSEAGERAACGGVTAVPMQAKAMDC